MGKGIFKNLNYIIEVFLNTIFPKEYKCLSCNEETEDELCFKCRKTIKLVKENINLNNIDIYCYSYYKGAIKELILEFKYHSDYNAGEYMSELLINRFEEIIQKSDIITYVPITSKKEKKRGFNQCKVICNYISKNINIKTKELIYKVKDNKEQKTLDMKSRLNNQKGLYEYKKFYDIKGKSILLIDDVYTTGATVSECANVLMKNGARKVNVLTIAKSTL